MTKSVVETPKDWRGVELQLGMTVLYGTGNSQAGRIYECRVLGEYTKGGKARLLIVRETHQLVHAESKRGETILAYPRLCTVVAELPATSVLARDVAIVRLKQVESARAVNLETHIVVPRERAWNAEKQRKEYSPCLMCDMEEEDMIANVCPNPQPDVI